MERDMSRHGSMMLQPPSQGASTASASSDQSLGKVPQTIADDGPTNRALEPANDSPAIEMVELNGAPQQLHAEYSTELK